MYTGVPTNTLMGGKGNDTFQINGLPASQIALHAGSGINTLDYSAHNGDVIVDLPLGSATGISGGITNIRNVIGSKGNDIIVGDEHANVLTGGTGRNLIIGGHGADTLVGGRDSDLLIGNYTDYDTNVTALSSILAEWLSGDTYATRISDITNGGGLNGAYVLNGTTVHNNSVNDTTTGDTGRDWFIASLGDVITDQVTNGANKETVTVF